MVNYPLSIINDEILKSLNETLKKLSIKGKGRVQEVTKKDSYGDLCTPVFPLAKENKWLPHELAKEIATSFPENEYVADVVSVGGFVNYKLNRGFCTKLILETIFTNENFFKSDTYKDQEIMVEHTSANPNGPIHIGNFRGSIIGDVYARILKAVGANVKTHFYIDDLGHQIPVAVIGYELLKKYKKVKPDVKLDHYIGRIYGITHTMYDIQRLKQELKKEHKVDIGGNIYWLEAKEKQLLDNDKTIPKNQKQEYLKNFDFLFNVQKDIYKRFSKLYDDIKSCLIKDKVDLPSAIPDLNRRYMEQEKEAVKVVRATCGDAIEGHKEELALLGIIHDNFDWEADLQWSGKVDDALDKLTKNGYIIKEGKARIFDSNKAADLEGAREFLKLKKSYEVPNAILITSSGDTLYLLRDIAYSIEKVDHFKKDKVYNVIAKEQELTQRQLNLAIRATGRSDAANKIWHLNYEMLELRGALTTMSARRLQYITPLELYNRTKEAILKTHLKDRPYPDDEKDEIAKIVAIGAIKYSIIAIGLMKRLIFDPMDVISLENNTSPFIQYAFARSQNILAKTDFKWTSKLAKSLISLQEDEEWNLIIELIKLPKVIQNAAEQIKPELICSYLFDVANLFNQFYAKHRVLDAKTKELVHARLALTYASGFILQTGLHLLGIDSPNRM
ncbi:MAG: arginine--tRNA ligase [Asgard group archaeon]|nr:arginine--tRNA ligase [Asgard group archaeon]